jgi:phosphotransferase system HPr-like phosphotransfer protein
MMLGAGKGAVIRVSADGEDEAAAAGAVEALVAERFGEDE